MSGTDLVWLIDGMLVTVVYVEHYGARFPQDARTGAWVSRSPKGEGQRSQFHICGCCGCRPCHNACPLQEVPDLLRYKAARAGLTEDAWLVRYEAEHGQSFFAAYPEHPETIRRRAEGDGAAPAPERSIPLHALHTP